MVGYVCHNAAIAWIAGVSVMPPVCRTDMDFDISPNRALARPHTEDGIEEVRSGFQVPENVRDNRCQVRIL